MRFTNRIVRPLFELLIPLISRREDHNIGNFIAALNIVSQLQLQGRPSEESIHTYWYEQANTRKGDLAHKWEELKKEEYFGHFATLLTRLSDWEVRNKINASAVVEVIQSVIASPVTRKLIFRASMGADADCHEVPLQIFNDVQCIARFRKLEEQGATLKELWGLTEGMATQAFVAKVTPLVMQKQWDDPNGRRIASNNEGTGPNMSEALEWEMALRKNLVSELNLPFPVNPLYADKLANLIPSDIAFAKQYVDDAMNDENRVVEVFMNLPVWHDYMKRICAKEIEQLSAPYWSAMEKFQQAAEPTTPPDDKISPEDYAWVAGAINTNRNNQIDLVLEKKTRQLFKEIRKVKEPEKAKKA